MVGFKDFSLGYEIVTSDGCSFYIFLIISFYCHFEPQSWWATLQKDTKTLGTWFFFLGKVVPESMAEIGLRLFFLSRVLSGFIHARSKVVQDFSPPSTRHLSLKRCF